MKLKYCFIFVLHLLSRGLYALGPDEPTKQVDLSSPYHTINNHRYYLQGEQFNPSLAARSFSLENRSLAEAEELAIRLKQIISGEGLSIDLELVPRKNLFFDSTLQKHKYVLSAHNPEIYLIRKEDGRWLYSENTAEKIDVLYKELFPFGTHKLLDWLPRLGQNSFMGLHIWQYLGILILITLAFFVHRIFTFFFRKGMNRLLLSLGYEVVAKKFVLPVARPLSLLVVFFFLFKLSPVLQLPEEMGYWLMLFLKAMLPFFTTLVFYRLVDFVGVYLDRFAKNTDSTLDDQLVPLLRKSLRTFVVIIGILFILDNLTFDVTAFIAGLSIGGLAFALAAQDTIKNFFGSLMIFIDKPFQIGDWITSGEIDGTVEEVGFRSTRIRTFRNSVTYVPNGKLADWVVDNHGLREYRRFSTKLALTYDTPPPLVELFVEGLREIVKEHPQTRKDYFEVHLNELGAHSLDVMFYIFFAVPTWSEELKARHEVLIQVMQLAETLGIRFAFPTQTLHMETFPGKPGLTPEYSKSLPEILSAKEAFMHSRQLGKA